jgi:hypothetical protein
MLASSTDHYSHGLPKILPGSNKTNLLTLSPSSLSSPTRLEARQTAKLTAGDEFLWRHLYDRYGTDPFPRGYIDAGRLNRLLGDQIQPVEPLDPTSLDTLLRCLPYPDERRRYREPFRGLPLRAGGEGEQHKRLKEYVAENPEVLGIGELKAGEPEAWLVSGDCVDVQFSEPERLVFVEVKPANAAVREIERGIYQVVKYRAVYEAAFRASGQRVTVHGRLVLGGGLSAELRHAAQILDVIVIENVIPPPTTDGLSR